MKSCRGWLPGMIGADIEMAVAVVGTREQGAFLAGQFAIVVVGECLAPHVIVLNDAVGEGNPQSPVGCLADIGHVAADDAVGLSQFSELLCGAFVDRHAPVGAYPQFLLCVLVMQAGECSPVEYLRIPQHGCAPAARYSVQAVLCGHPYEAVVVDGQIAHIAIRESLLQSDVRNGKHRQATCRCPCDQPHHQQANQPSHTLIVVF